MVERLSINTRKKRASFQKMNSFAPHSSRLDLLDEQLPTNNILDPSSAILSPKHATPIIRVENA